MTRDCMKASDCRTLKEVKAAEMAAEMTASAVTRTDVFHRGLPSVEILGSQAAVMISEQEAWEADEHAARVWLQQKEARLKAAGARLKQRRRRQCGRS